jgi:hypothetical protein
VNCRGLRLDDSDGAVVPSPRHDVKRRMGIGTPRPPASQGFPGGEPAAECFDAVSA